MTHIKSLKSMYYTAKSSFFTIIFCFISVISFANQPSTNKIADTISVGSESEHAHTNATHEESHDEEKFNINKTIMEHISDAHQWHLWAHTSLPLPVILYTNKGIEIFSSAHFGHGEESHIYQGNYPYQLIHEKIKVVNEQGEVNPNIMVLDFSITKNVASLLLAVICLIIIFLSVSKSYAKRGVGAPKGLQSWIEPLIIFVRDDIAEPNLGKRTAKFMPFLLTIFFFIWFVNMLGLIPFFPGGANVTGNIAVTMVLAVITFIITNLNGKKTYWGHIFLPHVPWWLYPLMVVLEIIGIFTKPIALMIRLFANITAGHILVLSLVCLTFIFKSLTVGIVAAPFIVFISAIELLVAFMQAFIFTMLAALYIGMALEEPVPEAHH